MMDTANRLCSSQADYQPRHQYHHHHHQRHYQHHRSQSSNAFSSTQKSHNPPLNQHQLSPQHRQQAGRKQLLRPASDEGRATRATSDGGPGTTRLEAAPAPAVLQPTNAPDTWPRSQQSAASTTIYTPPHLAFRKQQPTLLHNQHHHPPLHSHSSSRPPLPNSYHNSLSTKNSDHIIPFVHPINHRHTFSGQQPSQIRRLDDQDQNQEEHSFGELSRSPYSFPAYNYSSMEPSSPKAPSSAPIESSSPSESAKNALSGHQAQLFAVKMTRNRQFQECSEPASSPPSLGQSTGSDSDSLPTSSPAQASALRGDVFPAAPTTPFRFPGSRRNSNTNTNSSTAVAQTQQTQATVEPPNTSNCYFAYCLDRGNGLYTRLVPADTLPASVGYAPLQSDSRGMIVLQDPLTKGFSGVPSPLSLGSVAAGNSLPTFSARPVQQLNFTAYAAAQVTPFAQRAGLANTNASPAKKNKVYCDKWVHEGICAFTQQGCKFKHEMPHDRNIQRSLGLFHGYPNWYKKLQAQESQQTTTDTATASPPLALPAPPGIGKQQAPALLAHTTGFTPGLFTSTQSSLVCPVSVVSVPTAPPPTPLPQQASLYQPCYPPFAVAVAGSRLRGNSVSSIDGPWRATGVNAPSWRTQHANSTADNINANVNPSSFTSVPLADSSTAQLTDNFVHSLGINEPLGPVHPNQQQQTAPLPVPVAANTMDAFLPTMTIPTDTYPVGFGLGFSRGRGGSLGAVDNELADSFLGSTSSGSNKSGRGAFGPIGPPSRATQETTDASGAFSFRGSQTFSSNQQPGEDEKSNHRDEEW